MEEKRIDLTEKKCIPCEGGMPALTPEVVDNLKKEIGKEWSLTDYKKISKKFKFKNFKKAINFVNQIAQVAEAESHHPDITINYNKVIVSLTTHAVKGLSQNDFIMAAKIDNIFSQK